MATDRLADLHRLVQARAPTADPPSLASIADAYVRINDAQDERYLSIEAHVATILAGATELRRLTEIERRAVTRAALQANLAAFEAQTGHIQKAAKRARDLLREAQSAGVPIRNDTEGRVAQALFDVTLRRFRSAMTDFKAAVDGYNGVVDERTRRFIRISDAKMADEEVEKMVAQGLTQEQISGLLDDTVLALQERYRDVMRLERTVAELQELFGVLQFLVVEEQQVVLDRVQERVEDAREEATRGAERLGVAEDGARRARCQQVVCLCIALVALLATVITLSKLL
jgi:t-SNARE complex subunit (syntaxin)